MNPNNPNPDPLAVDQSPVNLKQYEFDNYKTVTVSNPKKERFDFLVEGKPYSIAGGTQKRFPGYIATLYIRKMAMILAQDEKKIQFITDNSLLEKYYKRLIVDVEDLVGEHESPDPDTAVTSPQEEEDLSTTKENPFDTAEDDEDDDLDGEDDDSSDDEDPKTAPAPGDKPFVFTHEGNTFVAAKEGEEIVFTKGGKPISQKAFDAAYQEAENDRKNT